MNKIPNILTLFRLFVAFFVIILHLSNIKYNQEIILVIFTLACLSDFFDGFLSRKFNHISNFGRCFDPIADKILIVPLLFIMHDRKLFNVAYPSLILIRELLVSGLREFLQTKNITIHVSFLAKIKTTVQMLVIGIILTLNCPTFISFVNNFIDFNILKPLFMLTNEGLMFAATAITVITGAEYVYKNRKFLS